MRKWITLIFIFTIFFYVTFAYGQEKVPRFSEKYFIPAFTMYVVDDGNEWNELTQFYVGRYGDEVCGMMISYDVQIKEGEKWKVVDRLYFVYIPKYKDNSIHTETIGHEVLHIVERAHPLFKQFYNVDKYMNITAKECE